MIARIVRYLNYSFVDQKEFKVSILSLLLLVVVIVIATIVSRYARRLLQQRILPRFHIEAGLQYTLLRLDWVALDRGIEGRVENISLRSTVIITNENMAVIMPNSKLVQNKFVNYSYGNQLVRLNIPVGVAYASDLDRVSEALLEAARSVKEVLSEPEPVVHFAEFGDLSLNLQIRVWINEPRDHITICSHVNFAIERSFRKHNIEIPFPQRDVHLRTGSVSIEKSAGVSVDRQPGAHVE